jgi:hypothetical protein
MYTCTETQCDTRPPQVIMDELDCAIEFDIALLMLGLTILLITIFLRVSKKESK